MLSLLLRGWLGCTLAALCLPLSPLHAQEKPLSVLSSIAPVALIASEIGGPEVQVQTLLPGGADPHSFALKVSDREKLQQAQLLLWLGPDFERFLAKLAPQGPHQLALGDLPGLQWPSVPAEQTKGHDHHNHGHAHGPEGRDMHLWLNPHNAERIADALARQFSLFMPAARPQFLARAASFSARLQTLDRDWQARLAPLRQRPFGVYHQGYDHFVQHYGLNLQVSLSQLPEQALSAKHLQQAKVKMAQARCLITDQGENNAEKLQQLFQVPVWVADPLAQAGPYADYAAFFQALGAVFERCLGARDGKL
jgi:zinc transport system substrate-binding protein